MVEGTILKHDHDDMLDIPERDSIGGCRQAPATAQRIWTSSLVNTGGVQEELPRFTMSSTPSVDLQNYIISRDRPLFISQ
jgi:hypothetical protein